MTSMQKLALAMAMVAASAPAWAGVQVPEPGTLGLMSVGVVALVVATLRKRK